MGESGEGGDLSVRDESLLGKPEVQAVPESGDGKSSIVEQLLQRREEVRALESQGNDQAHLLLGSIDNWHKGEFRGRWGLPGKDSDKASDEENRDLDKKSREERNRKRYWDRFREAPIQYVYETEDDHLVQLVVENAGHGYEGDSIDIRVTPYDGAVETGEPQGMTAFEYYSKDVEGWSNIEEFTAGHVSATIAHYPHDSSHWGITDMHTTAPVRYAIEGSRLKHTSKSGDVDVSTGAQGQSAIDPLLKGEEVIKLLERSRLVGKLDSSQNEPRVLPVDRFPREKR